MTGRHGRAAAIGLVLMMVPGLAGAGDYRIVMGDKLAIRFTGLEAPVDLLVDADGEIRLPALGGFPVAGLTLDEAEASVSDDLRGRELFVDPQVSLTMAGYAPVIVAGDVVAPGQYDYFPGMSVAAALAMSGGSRLRGISSVEIARARATAAAEVHGANISIAANAARLARVTAFLDGDTATAELTTEHLALIPSVDQVNLDRLVAAESDALNAARDRAATLVQSWDEEIATITDQSSNYSARISVQNEIVASSGAALADARSLQKRGLQTATRVADLEEREANARSRLLELETAKLSAERAITDARRARTRFLADLRRDVLEERNEILSEIDEQRARHARHAEQLLILTGGQSTYVLDEDTVVVDITLQSPRPDRRSGTRMAPDSLIYPGETLVVEISPIDTLEGG